MNYKYSKEGVLIDKNTETRVEVQTLSIEEKESIKKYTIEHVEKKLTKNLKLKKIPIPLKKEPQTYIMMTSDFLTNEGNLLVIIPSKHT
jgi:hypothetical protein